MDAQLLSASAVFQEQVEQKIQDQGIKASFSTLRVSLGLRRPISRETKFTLRFAVRTCRFVAMAASRLRMLR